MHSTEGHPTEGRGRWVVTGANRGIGLELVRQLAKRGQAVEALARGQSDELQRIVDSSAGKVRRFSCDVTDEASVHAACQGIGQVAVDVLVNNAGVMGAREQPFASLEMEDLKRTFDANTLGPIRVAKALLPQLGRSLRPRIVSISSGLGSIGDNHSGGMYGYRISKAGLNMAARTMAHDLANIISVVMNPGWVQTDMGGRGAPILVEDSAAKMIAIIDELRPAQSGSFIDYRGGTIVW